MEINKDKPIQSHEVDLLHREKFVNSIVNLLCNNDDDDSLTIGLYGEWGSGKTSIINMIYERLTSVDKEGFGYGEGEEYIKVIHFNPWLYSNASDLTRQFFTHLQGELEKNKAHKFTTIVKKLGQYKEAIIPSVSLSFGPTAGIATKVGIDALTTYTSQTENRSLQTIKDEIVEKLKELKQKIVIFIDDIDRLSDEEIVTTFKLVKMLADFPYVTYVLAFDYEVVAEALNRVQHNRGKEYMEKIIQVPIAIPAIQRVKLDSVMKKRLNNIFSEEDWQTVSKKRWDALKRDGIDLYMKSIRDVNRYCNLLYAYYMALAEEVDIVDLIGITILHVFEEKIYTKLPQYKSILCKDHLPKRVVDTTDFYLNEFKNTVEETSHCKEGAKNILGILFPRIHDGLECTTWTLDGGSDDVLRENHSIQLMDNFDRYFIWSISEEDISNGEIYKILVEYAEEDIVGTLLRYNKNNNLRRLLIELTAAIRGKYSDRLTPERIQLLVKSIVYNIDMLYGDWDEFLNVSLDRITLRLVDALLRLLENDKRWNLIENIFNDGTVHISVLWLILNNYRKDIQGDEVEHQKKDMIFSKLQIQNLESIFVERCIQWVDTNRYHKDTYGVYFIWSLQELCATAYEHIVKKLRSEDRGIVKILELSIETVTTSEEPNRIWRFKEKNLENIISVEELYKNIQQLIEKNKLVELNKKEQAAVAIFLYYMEHKDEWSLKNSGVNEQIIQKKLLEIESSYKS